MIVLVIVGLVVGGGIGYMMAPPKEIPGETVTVTVTKEPLDGETIRIGNIFSDDANLETATPLVHEILEPRLNQYLAMLGYDTTVQFLSDNAMETPAIHLEKVQGLHATGVDLVIGGRWSSQAQSALPYVNENKMLLFSPSSTSPLLAIPDDNCYRMCPTDVVQSEAIAEMLWTWGIDAVIVMQRVDPWADGIYNLLVPAFEAKGGTVYERVSYNPETKEFSSDLQTVENLAKEALAEYGEGRVAIEVIGFSEVAIILTQAEGFPTIYDEVTWFGSDGTAITQRLKDDSPRQADHLRVYSTLAAPGISPKFRELNATFYPLVGQVVGYYEACTYDIGWALVEGVLTTQNQVAEDIIPFVMPICDKMYGTTGWCKLNADGDRFPPDYEIWGYDERGGATVDVNFGRYLTFDGVIEWYESEIGFTPPGH
jgi:branched-chain amino acid transport system substrate-binding protein